MEYDELYKVFKEEFPEGSLYFERREKETSIDETAGMHVKFGLVVVPYILDNVRNKRMSLITRIFSFLETMATCEEIRVNEVLDVTVLEQIIDEGRNTLEQCKQYMGTNTLEHCEAVEQYFWL